jgi:transcriptional regulator with XRE-family HTH domain
VRYHRERIGWTQRQLAKAAGYSERLVSKAEAGKPISAATVADLAMALSTAEAPVYPEDLIVDPVQLAKQYIAAEYTPPHRVVDAIRHFLDEDVVIRLAGDPATIPFAGEHRGIAAVERVFDIFFSVLEVPPGHDPTPWYQFVGQGNEVVIWGKSWMHPIGRPMERPIDLVHRMKFRRGKLIEVEVVFDSLEGSRVLRGED